LASIDTAYTESEENDPSALTIWGVFRDANAGPFMLGNPKIMLLYAWQGRLEFNQLVQKVIDTCTKDQRHVTGPRFNIDRLIIEAKASGLSVGQELHRLIGFAGKFGIELINPQKQGDKVSRVHAIQHLFSDGLVYAPDREFADMVIDQCAVFPKGSHDDLVDSTSIDLRYLRDFGFALRREEHSLSITESMMYKPRERPLYDV
jgi:predicted phage terminase large subunit-like protein